MMGHGRVWARTIQPIMSGSIKYDLETASDSLCAPTSRDNLTKIALAILLTTCGTLTPVLIKASQRHGNAQYAPANVVICAEAMKMLICAAAMMSFTKKGSHQVTRRKDVTSIAKICALAFVYAVHNNVMIETVKIVGVASFQVWFSWRILVTALALRVFMNKRFKHSQMIALFLLVAGTMITRYNGHQTELTVSLYGLAMICVLVFTSSIAAVWNEAMLKNEMIGSLSSQNLTLYAFGFAINVCFMWWRRDLNVSREMQAWSPWVWATVASMSLLGIVTSATLKYADNIVRAFSASGSIILTSLLSWLLFGEEMTLTFGVGGGLTCAAVIVYFL